MAGLDLPRVLYVGDVQIEDSHHSSAQLFRLLSTYPPSLLEVIETWTPSRLDRRLPQVKYLFGALAPGVPRVGRGAGFAWHAATATCLDARLRLAADAFAPQAVLTIGYGFGWIAAARLARSRRLPLLFIAHDEWPKLRGSHRLVTAWLRHQFATTYRQANTRLCVSPLMADQFQRRYGCAASVLYPVCGDDGPTPGPVTPRVLAKGDRLVIGFAGASGQEVMHALRELAPALARGNGSVIAYGPFDEAQRRELLSLSSAFEFPGFVDTAREMIGQLRARADILFLPMSFDSATGDYATLSFPSKLADYTRIGLPILVYGPAYCSAAQWAANHGEAAELVTTAGVEALAGALGHLKDNAARRQQLAQRAAGAAEMFAPSRGRAALHAALQAALATAGAGMPQSRRA